MTSFISWLLKSWVWISSRKTTQCPFKWHIHADTVPWQKNVSVPSHSHRETDFTHVLPNSNNLNSLFNKRPVNENEERWHSCVFKMLFWKQSHSLLFIQQRFRHSSWNIYDKFISWSGIGPHVLDSTCSNLKKKRHIWCVNVLFFKQPVDICVSDESGNELVSRKKKEDDQPKIITDRFLHFAMFFCQSAS